jgi:hypothetical protein
MSLDTKEAREALAKAMVAPLQTAINYQGIGRKLLRISRTERVMEPLFEMEDYISEKYWPEWKVTFEYDVLEDIIVQAPSAVEARKKAEEIRGER